MYVSADPELSEIEHLRIRLMVLSLAYYTLDESVVEDHVFDKMAERLKALNAEKPHFLESGILWEYFVDWMGNPSAHLLPMDPDALSEAIHLVHHIRLQRGEKGLIGSRYHPINKATRDKAKELALMRSAHARSS